MFDIIKKIYYKDGYIEGAVVDRIRHSDGRWINATAQHSTGCGKKKKEEKATTFKAIYAIINIKKNYIFK